MRKIIIVLILLLSFLMVKAQSPHGESLDFDCVNCHTEEGWEINVAMSTFDHSETSFVLDGQHANVECELCHSSLIFNEVGSKCVDCHTDMHQQTVGFDCSNCHDTKTWIIENVQQIHRNSRFPLLGIHADAECVQCHRSATNLQFETLSVDCYAHQDNYLSSTEPNHVQEGYSSNCIECHNERAIEWTAAGINHSFFPLTGGHAQPVCTDCHEPGKFEKVSKECIDCHRIDYETADNHVASGFSTNCTECHNTEPNWQLTTYKNHDAEFFPIYSGKHNGEWNSCTECHNDGGNYASFTCVDCHEHGKLKMDLKHNEERDYIYDSNECYSCHPQGRED